MNPDYAQHPLRVRALREGKALYLAVPRLRSERPFIELDPAKLCANATKAASIAGAERYGHAASIEEIPPIDLIVCGAVGVNRNGARLGKGGGFSDLEFALVVEAGLAKPDVPIVTTVHSLQVIDEPIPMEPHDISVDFIATRRGSFAASAAFNGHEASCGRSSLRNNSPPSRCSSSSSRSDSS